MSIKTSIYNQEGEKVKDMSLNESIFKVPAKQELLHQAMLAQMGNERQVIADTKDRSEVRGGGKKPWRQKGTGRARAGSSRSPIWIGGGVTFGPTTDRNFSKKINKKMRQKAIFMVISDRLADNNLVIVDKVELKEAKTKAFNQIIKNIENKVLKVEENKKRSVLFINSKSEDALRFSGRNLVGVKVISLDNINILDLLKYRKLIMTEETVAKLEKVYNK